jgi:hypothetical protein
MKKCYYFGPTHLKILETINPFCTVFKYAQSVQSVFLVYKQSSDAVSIFRHSSHRLKNNLVLHSWGKTVDGGCLKTKGLFAQYFNFHTCVKCSFMKTLCL